jgi:spermidine synthase
MLTTFCAIFFLSGTSALIFESLWFHLTGLSLGNSIWAISIVLASFMGGLSLGEGLVAFLGHRISRPTRFYAALELVIGLSGGLLVLALPHLTKFLIPLFNQLHDHNIALNILRGAVAFSLMAIPTTAMGATFPVLGKAATLRDPNFGKVLGRLYGWNTLGAVVGVCASELFLIKWFGLSGAGLVAASCNLLAAGVAWHLARDERKAKASSPAKKPKSQAGPIMMWRLLIASGLAGFIFLALEVVWFRFLELFFLSTSLNFTILLAVVLSGISLGGLFAGYQFQKRADIRSGLMPAVLVSGILLSLLYNGFRQVIVYLIYQPQGISTVLIGTLLLAFPVAFLSGVIFTILGRLLHDQVGSGTRTIGLLTLANTLGSMGGSLFAGLVFLPLWGMEKTFFFMALAYGVIAALVFEKEQFGQSSKKTVLLTGIIAVYGISIVFYPFGLMKNFYSLAPFVRAWQYGERRVAMKEGTNETIQYFRKDLAGEPYYYRLVTNHYYMSATTFESRRYMSYFAYLPLVVHPGIHDALLICYGVGVTAKAITTFPAVRNIDIVDISKDILQMSSVVYPDPKTNPTLDPRVRTYIEDGRFFLLSRKKTYDLITGEPPPPMCKGVVNLYTREHFKLIYDRLSPGGMTTYWLPVHELSPRETRSIVKGFCQVFKDCSLWASSEAEWMLVGIKDQQAKVPYRDFVHVWDDPVLGGKLRGLGFVDPEEFGSLFIADGQRLRDWVGDVPALTDNFPKILESHFTGRSQLDPPFREFLDASGSQQNFMASEQIARIWPAELRQGTEKYFATRNWILKIMGTWENELKVSPEERLHYLSDPLLRPFFLFALGSEPYVQEILARSKARPGAVAENKPDQNPAVEKMREEVKRLHQLIPGLPKVSEFED